MKIFDVFGREVANLVDEQVNAGYHSVNWDAAKAATGVYFCKLEAARQTRTLKLTLIQ